MRFEIDVMDISLCRAAIDAVVPENPTKTDKAERQTVFETVWRSVSLHNMLLKLRLNTYYKGMYFRFPAR